MLSTKTSSSNGRRGNAKVKSGCRTCKIRKVKCDERFPACHRCISTGRVCEGYGIWGGGGRPHDSTHQRDLTTSTEVYVVPRPPASVSALPSNAEEKSYFEWFVLRTVTKLPGSYISSFWTTLVLQASMNEPAVLHAVLALSSVHKGGNDEPWKIDNAVASDRERFALHHYVKAISHLETQFADRTRASSRVTLITCIIFVSLELLRGHFETAQTHLRNGLKILEEANALRNVKFGVLHSKVSLDLAEDWIVEAFSRLNLQVELFKHDHRHPCQILHIPRPEGAEVVFISISEAWQHLERLLNSVFIATDMAHRQTASDRKSFYTLLRKQQLIQQGLRLWLDQYEVFMMAAKDNLTTEQSGGCELLRPYHTMASIMTDTCLRQNDESAFDIHTDQFILLIKQCLKLSVLASREVPAHASPAQVMNMTRSIIDMGWIPLLYYIATKCRVHRIRLQAIKLLQSTPHREGIWDARTAACVATKVMRMEERDFYREFDTADDFSLTSSPGPQDLLLPALPESYRLREVEVVLSGSPMDRILLFCKRDSGGVDCRVALAQFDVHLGCWDREIR